MPPTLRSCETRRNNNEIYLSPHNWEAAAEGGKCKTKKKKCQNETPKKTKTKHGQQIQTVVKILRNPL